MVVFLHSLSPGGEGIREKGKRAATEAEDIERMKQEIACMSTCFHKGNRGGDATESKGRKRTILTMKSLILAQDER